MFENMSHKNLTNRLSKARKKHGQDAPHKTLRTSYLNR